MFWLYEINEKFDAIITLRLCSILLWSNNFGNNFAMNLNKSNESRVNVIGITCSSNWSGRCAVKRFIYIKIVVAEFNADDHRNKLIPVVFFTWTLRSFKFGYKPVNKIFWTRSARLMIIVRSFLISWLSQYHFYKE